MDRVDNEIPALRRNLKMVGVDLRMPAKKKKTTAKKATKKKK
jgi:hypothetical protein